jgi:hypothetical protein
MPGCVGLQVTVAVAEVPRVTLLGETEQAMPAGFGMTFVARLIVPANPFSGARETVAVVVVPTIVEIALGLIVSEKSKNVTLT